MTKTRERNSDLVHAGVCYAARDKGSSATLPSATN